MEELKIICHDGFKSLTLRPADREQGENESPEERGLMIYDTVHLSKWLFSC